MTTQKKKLVALVIPCYRVREYILGVISQIGSEVDLICVVDDGCPQNSGKHVIANNTDKRVTVLFHETNLGVGAAVKTGYRWALAAQASVIIKFDGDGQMEALQIPIFAEAINSGLANYAKGNRFTEGANLRSMPTIRYLGNKLFSTMSRLTTHYPSLDDVLNGFTAIDSTTLARLPLDKIANDYFFESDMLFYLSRLGATLREIPTVSRYTGAPSSLSILHTLLTFPPRYLCQWLGKNKSPSKASTP